MSVPGLRVDGPASGPTLLLCNSLGTTSAVWDRQMPALTGLFRVVRFELPGHGGTSVRHGAFTVDDLAADALSALDETGSETASVAGLSIGGAVALRLAMAAPERVDRLVLACSAAQWPPAEVWRARADLVRTDGVLSLRDQLLERWFTPSFPDQHGEVKEQVEAMLASVSAEGYTGCCSVLEHMDIRAELAVVRAQTLVIGATADPVVSRASLLDLVAGIPDCSLKMLPGAHLVNLERPELFNAALVDHLAGPAGERGRAIRSAVLGAEHVRRSETAGSTGDTAFFDLVTRHAWGDIWSRPGLDRRTRSAVTIAMLVALGRFDELPMHLRGARNNGLTEEEIVEVLLQSAVYCGAPAGNSAFAAARAVFGGGDP